MKELIILVTCLALTPLFTGCGGSSGTVDPPKDQLELLQKKSKEAREKTDKDWQK